jgi:hypothetical protein
MNGIPFRVNGKGQVLVRWVSRNRMYWSVSDAAGKRFASAVAMPNQAGRPELLSVAVSNRKGEVATTSRARTRTDESFVSTRNFASKRQQAVCEPAPRLATTAPGRRPAL